MNTLNRQLIEKIYTSDGQFVIAVTGGGTSFISDLFSVPGASSTVLEALVPYHQSALSGFLRSRKTHDCSSATARAMAMVSYERALNYGAGEYAFGIGCTAAIATNRTRQGQDRCHIALQNASRTMTFDLVLDKADDRSTQEAQCSQSLGYAVAQFQGITAAKPVVDLTAQGVAANESWQKLLAGSTRLSGSGDYQVVMPGAFNPLHDGHRGMIKVARERLPGKVALELSIENVDKPPLDFMTMQERQFEEYDLVFTRAPTFEQKSDIFPGATFVVGLDTIVRIDDPRYYDGSESRRDLAIQRIAANGNRFLVFGRLEGNSFQTLSDVMLTPQLTALCDEVNADDFRLDISSTELRADRKT